MKKENTIIIVNNITVIQNITIKDKNIFSSDNFLKGMYYIIGILNYMIF